ncbi:neocarzinostatin apoprotein domain-containing protein [Kribbella sp. CA-253562]|uniref:neocarzinostatin apoprotein domain-containing protein n=1 Tax=Kribbella sp. CA-253562 TaxID=3239942 RepID=UPI003D8B3F7C
MRLLAAITAATVLLGSMTVPAVAAPPPELQVSRTFGLTGGDEVRVSGRGFAPGSEVRIVQCDTFVDWFDGDCPDRTVTTAGSTGRIATRVTLGDPVFRRMEFGEPTTVYCRADLCHLYAVGNAPDGSRLVLDSGALGFKGSPATITATPSTDLAAEQWVTVRGTAYGAEWRQVRIVQHACFEIIQETGCYGERPTVTTWVRADGTYATPYRVNRWLPDGTDCFDVGFLGECYLSVTVLDRAGQPDDSFGFSPNGDMKTPITFRSS